MADHKDLDRLSHTLVSGMGLVLVVGLAGIFAMGFTLFELLFLTPPPDAPPEVQAMAALWPLVKWLAALALVSGFLLLYWQGKHASRKE